MVHISFSFIEYLEIYLSMCLDSYFGLFLLKVQNAKQVNSALKQKMEGGIEEFKPPEVRYWRIYVIKYGEALFFGHTVNIFEGLKFYNMDNLLHLFFVI